MKHISAPSTIAKAFLSLFSKNTKGLASAHPYISGRGARSDQSQDDWECSTQTVDPAEFLTESLRLFSNFR